MSAPILLINSIIQEHECKILFDTKSTLRSHLRGQKFHLSARNYE